MVDADRKPVETPHGTFRPRVAGSVAISVVQVKHAIFSKGKKRKEGDYSFIEHRKMPKVLPSLYWAWYVATYDLKGKHLVLHNDWKPAK